MATRYTLSADTMPAAGDSNTFTNAEQTKLSGIEATADITDMANVSTVNNSLQAEATLTVVTVTFTFDMSAAINVKFTLSAGTAETLAFSNLVAGQRGFIVITQNASATTLTYGAGNPRWGGGTDHVMSVGSGDTDILEYYCDGTNVYLSTYGSAFAV